MNMVSLPTVGLVVVKEGKLLLAYSNHKNAWYLPGGKVDDGESALQAIHREIQEELQLDLDDDKLKYYCHQSAHAYGESENVVMEQECFLYDLTEEINVAHEIGGVRYFSPADYDKEKVQVVGVLQVFEKLRKDGFVA